MTNRKPRRRNPAKIVHKKITSTKDKTIRLKIVRGLSRVEAQWVSKVLLDSLDDPCEEIRDNIITELGRRNIKLDLIYKKLNTPPWYVKSSCLRILGLKKNRQTVKHIGLLVDEPNTDVKVTAAQALGEIGGQDALAILTKLAKDKNQFVKTSAEAALRKTSLVKFI